MIILLHFVLYILPPIFVLQYYFNFLHSSLMISLLHYLFSFPLIVLYYSITLLCIPKFLLHYFLFVLSNCSSLLHLPSFLPHDLFTSFLTPSPPSNCSPLLHLPQFSLMISLLHYQLFPPSNCSPLLHLPSLPPIPWSSITGIFCCDPPTFIFCRELKVEGYLGRLAKTMGCFFLARLLCRVQSSLGGLTWSNTCLKV